MKGILSRLCALCVWTCLPISIFASNLTTSRRSDVAHWPGNGTTTNSISIHPAVAPATTALPPSASDRSTTIKDLFLRPRPPFRQVPGIRQNSREGSGGQSTESGSSLMSSAERFPNEISLFSQEELEILLTPRRIKRSAISGKSTNNKHKPAKLKRSKAKRSHGIVDCVSNTKNKKDKKHLKPCPWPKHAHSLHHKKHKEHVHVTKKSSHESESSEEENTKKAVLNKKSATGNKKVGIVDTYGFPRSSEKARRKPLIISDFVTDEVMHVQPKYHRL